MSTQEQIQANIRNSQKSSGPTSPEGKAASSRNHLINGLYTRTDFVMPEETDIYQLFCDDMHGSCDAGDAIEQCLAAEIASAAWRLRRCNLADGDVAQHCVIDPLLDATLEKQIRSIERARSHSTSVFHRSLNQLRKLQKERYKLERIEATPDPAPEPKPEPAPHTKEASKEEDFLNNLNFQIQSIMHCEEPDWDEIDRQIAENRAKAGAEQAKEAELASNCKPAEAAVKTGDPVVTELASNCIPAPTPSRTRLCPCKSGKKYKHCCAKKVA